MNEQNTTNKQSSNMGVAIGFFLCGLAFLAFPKFTGLLSWASWIFYVVGFVLVLFGILGACIEKFK